MPQKHLQQIDTETGEIQQGCLVYIPHRPKLKEPFVMTFQDAIGELGKDKELKAEHWRVLAILMHRLDFDNFINITQPQIAEYIGMATPNVNRAMKTLLAKNIIMRGPKVGRSYTYRLSPTLGWKGTVKNLNKERQRRLELVVNQTTDKQPTPTR